MGNSSIQSRFFVHFPLSALILLGLSTIGLSACGGDNTTVATITDDYSHPTFSWKNVATSNNYQPSGDITDLTPTFKWESISNATNYQLGHEDAGTYQRWHSYTLDSNQFSCAARTCSYTPTDISFTVGDQKVWWLRAKVAGAWQAWSSPHVFTVIDNPPPSTHAEPISPKGEINTLSPTFKWTPGNGATDYQFGHENQNGTNWNLYQLTANQANCQSSACSYKPSNTNFARGDKKTWWVRSKINNTWGTWSTGANFSIKSIVVPPSDNAFKIKVDTRKSPLVISPNNQFIISTKGTGYNYSVDCNNDGNNEITGVTGNYTCSYSTPGIYTISIIGSFPQIYYDTPPSGYPNYNTDARKITEIVQWGNQQWRSMENAFAGSVNMTISATDKPDLSQVTDMFRMFWLASKMNHDIGDWDVSHVTNMSDMFGSAITFNQDITGWDVSNVTDMAYMFDEAEKFNQDISTWNMSNVTTITEMFWGAKSFNQPIGSWDVSKVENMYNIFYKAENFNQDLSNWNVTSVKPSINTYPNYGMESIFRDAHLSTSNYDKLLISWSTQNVQHNIILGAPGVKYSAAASSARNRLINTFGWTIRDAGRL